MTNILVTGGAGYIGSHTCKALAAAGYTPITYDNLSLGHDWAVKWGPLERGELLDKERLAATLAKYRPSAVLHFAASAYVGESIADPEKYYTNNVAGTLALLAAMRSHAIDRMVFSSTCATYGTPRTVPLNEDDQQNPINPYGASKLMIERILADYGIAYGLRSISLRYFNAGGADADGEIGEDHNPETHLIPLVLDAAAGIRPHVTVFGNDYETKDRTCVRDYVHVTDIADAHVLALRKLEQGGARPAYNLGTGHGYSVLQVIQAAERVTGRKVPVVIGPRRSGDPAELFADATRARQELDWSPRYQSLDEIVATAWNWHRRQARR